MKLLGLNILTHCRDRLIDLSLHNCLAANHKLFPFCLLNDLFNEAHFLDEGI